MYNSIISSIKKNKIWLLALLLFLIIEFILVIVNNTNITYVSNSLIPFYETNKLQLIVIYKSFVVMLLQYTLYHDERNNIWCNIFYRVKASSWLVNKNIALIIIALIVNILYIILLYVLFYSKIEINILMFINILILETLAGEVLILLTNINQLKNISLIITIILFIVLYLNYNLILCIVLLLLCLIINHLVVTKTRILKEIE